MRKALIAALALMLIAPGAAAQKERKTPYWASIASDKALMRTGPGRNFPALWLYRRADLPIQVMEVYPSWRKVRDPDGTVGWMLVNLLSDARTALVVGAEPRPLHQAASDQSPVRFLAQPGVVGRVSNCAGGWCELDVKGRRGHIRTDHVWGVDPREEVE